VKKTLSFGVAMVASEKLATGQISLPAARLSFGSAVAFLVLVAALHVIKPELDPSWRFISEYAIGDNGWLMMLAFFLLALSCAVLFVALWSQVKTFIGKIGLVLLLVSAAGMFIAGLFPTDPITTSRDAMTMNGRLHELGAMLDLTPFAALFITFGLLRRNPVWAPARRALLLTAGLPLLGLIVFIGSVSMMLPSDGQFGPDVLVGWPNRFLVVSYCAWLITVARQVIRRNSQAP
jgi:hypothetical protein